jgi:hypothetical protein
VKIRDRFRFGNTPYNSLLRVEILVYLKDKEGEIQSKEVQLHLIEKNIELLVGNNTRDKWKVLSADYENTYYLDADWKRPFPERRTLGGHVAVELWTKTQEKETEREEVYNYIEVEIAEEDWEKKREKLTKEEVEYFEFDTKKDKLEEIKIDFRFDWNEDQGYGKIDEVKVVDYLKKEKVEDRETEIVEEVVKQEAREVRRKDKKREKAKAKTQKYQQ